MQKKFFIFAAIQTDNGWLVKSVTFNANLEKKIPSNEFQWILFTQKKPLICQHSMHSFVKTLRLALFCVNCCSVSVVLCVIYVVEVGDYERALICLITLRIFRCARAFEMMYVTKSQQRQLFDSTADIRCNQFETGKRHFQVKGRAR